MTMRFAFFYFMKNEPDKIGQTVPLHVEYWRGSDVAGYLGGPFSDRSGGLITFEAENMEAATGLINHDPFVTENLLEDKWIKEWVVKARQV